MKHKKQAFFGLITGLLLSCLCIGVSASSAGLSYTAPYGTITVDGVVDAAWDAAAWATVDNGHANGTTGGKFKVMHDDTYIYFLGQFTDTTGLDSKKNENFRVGLHLDNCGEIIGKNCETYESYIMTRDLNGKVWANIGGANVEVGEDKDINYTVVTNGNVHTWEAWFKAPEAIAAGIAGLEVRLDDYTDSAGWLGDKAWNTYGNSSPDEPGTLNFKAPCTHRGGTATCAAQAICIDCGKPYGDLRPHTLGTEMNASATDHWYTCSVCGGIADRTERHKGDGICTVCGTAFEPLTSDYNANLTYDAPYGTITVDGTIDDAWDSADWEMIENGNQNATTGQFKVMHDGTYLYFLGQYTDTTGLDINKNENFRVGIHYDYCSTIRAKHCETYELYIMNREMKLAWATYANKGIEIGEDKDINYAVSENGDTLTWEARFKMPHEIENGTVGFEVMLEDYTGEGLWISAPRRWNTYANYPDEPGTLNFMVKCVHTGGTATCTEKAICTECGDPYGELLAHTGGSATCIAKAICTECGNSYGEFSAHVGGTATCTAKAICAECGDSYGELAAHTVSPTAAWETNDTYHWHICATCGTEILDRTTHTGVGTCTECGTAFNTNGVTVDEINFPNEGFRTYVSQNFDTDGSGVLSEAELATVTVIDVSKKYFGGELKGIQYFTALRELDCSFNRLTALDISHNTLLTKLNCSHNNISVLDLSQNKALNILNCAGNDLDALDISKNTALTNLDCSTNYRLSALDLRMCTKLTELYCGYNNLNSLDISKNIALTTLFCEINSLTALNVSKNTALTKLMCEGNALISLDLSKNTKLEQLWCSSNKLVTLDVSNNTALNYLECSDNLLTSIDISHNATSMFRDFSSNKYGIPMAGSFDLSTLPGGFDTAKASNWVGGTVNGKILTLDSGATEVTYQYDCGNSKTETFTLIPHAHNASTLWYADETYHWYACTLCGDVTNGKALHTGEDICDVCQNTFPPIKNGLIDSRFYENNALITNYRVYEYEGDTYFIDDNNRIAKNKVLYLISGTQGWEGATGFYAFDADGKLYGTGSGNVVCGNYAFTNGVQVKTYGAFKTNEGNYYFVNDGYRIVKNKVVYLTNGAQGWTGATGFYAFGADGNLYGAGSGNVVCGNYAFTNGVQVKTYGAFKTNEGNYYFVNDGYRIVKNTALNIQLTEEGTRHYHYFGADGKLYTDNPVMFGDRIYIDGVQQGYGLYQAFTVEADGILASEAKYYYVNDGHLIARAKWLYVNSPELGNRGYYYFDENGHIDLMAEK